MKQTFTIIGKKKFQNSLAEIGFPGFQVASLAALQK